MDRMAETKAVKAALIKAGYTGVRVGHCTGTAWGWLKIKAAYKPGENFASHQDAIEKIAQAVTSRPADEYGGRISID